MLQDHAIAVLDIAQLLNAAQQVHDATRPWDCFPQLTHKQLFGSSQKSRQTSQLQPGLLTRAAQACLKSMVAAYQAAAAAAAAAGFGAKTSSSSSSSKAGLSFVLHGGDALELCGPGSRLGNDARFHAIDVSNVGDHAGAQVSQALVRNVGAVLEHATCTLM
jgi:hypothetical protein